MAMKAYIGRTLPPRTQGGISGSAGGNVAPIYKEQGQSIAKTIKKKIAKLIDEAGKYPPYKPTLERENAGKKAMQDYIKKQKQLNRRG